MRDEPSEITPEISEKAHKAEERRLRWLDRFPGNPLVHLLVFSRWFRLVVVVILLLPGVVALTWLRLWVTSPAGIEPVIKVSVVDLVQAWSLQRSAVRLAAAGKDQEAARAWHLALANNRADLELARACVRHAVRSESQDPMVVSSAMGLIPWLLHLGRTNRVDLALAAQVLERNDMPDQALALLRLIPAAEGLTPEEEAVTLKALFQTGQFKEFGARWERQERAFENDAEMGLYRAAYLAGWGDPGQMTPAAERLAAAAQDPKLEILASRLQLSVSLKKLDAAGYGEALTRLERAQADRLIEQVNQWRLLASLGKSARARELAEAYLPRIVTVRDVVHLARAYQSLDLPDRARAVLDRYGPQYGDSDGRWAVELWETYAQLLADARDWTALEHLAVRLRAMRRAGPALTGVSHLFEGRALRGQGQQDQAAVAFGRIPEAAFPDPGTGLHTARGLIDLGYPELALRTLTRFESALQAEPSYWLALFEATYLVRQDATELTRAARRAYESQPSNTVFISNLAAALLINREEPSEALRLTLEVISRLPESPVARINHAFALGLNQRFDEAEAVLRQIGTASLNDEQRTAYHLALAEARCGQRKMPEAGRELGLVQTKYLFPRQVQRVEELKAQLAATAGG